MSRPLAIACLTLLLLAGACGSDRGGIDPGPDGWGFDAIGEHDAATPLDAPSTLPDGGAPDATGAGPDVGPADIDDGEVTEPDVSDGGDGLDVLGPQDGVDAPEAGPPVDTLPTDAEVEDDAGPDAQETEVVSGPVCGDGACEAPEGCAGCAEDCGACGGECCAEHDSSGCDDADVTACVCGLDGTCCAGGSSWDALCAVLAAEDCGAACASCGDLECAPEEGCETCPQDCGGCPGDCCSANGTPGCDDANAWACACDLEPYCCEGDWDGVCAGLAALVCGAECETACGDDACGYDETCVSCPEDCGACPAPCGDGTCGATESCQLCPSDCGPCGGDCCDANLTPGCELPQVSWCTCVLDPFCCEGLWDAVCVEVAQTACAAPCDVCGDAACAGDEDCTTCAEDCGACEGKCCGGNGSPGCEDPAVTDCVCDGDPYCCLVEWDATCGELAGACGVVCPACGDGACDTGLEDCGSCPADCGPCLPGCGDGACEGEEHCASCAEDCGACTGDCCQSGLTPGCDHPGVAACVCSSDTYCCHVAWDAGCALAGAEACGAQCPCEPPCEGTCGDGTCGDGEGCDTCAEDCGACEGECCDDHPGLGCADPEITACVCPLDPVCCEVHWDAFCVQTAAITCGAGCAECGDGLCELDEDCASCPDDCGECVEPGCGDAECGFGEDCQTCPADCGLCAGACCSAHGAPGCSDPVVTACACAVDSLCCKAQWSDTCTLIATVVCGHACGDCGDGLCAGGESCWTCSGDCGECGGDCCAEHESPGCEDPAVTDCVCAQDPHCCELAWDTICATEVQPFGCGACP